MSNLGYLFAVFGIVWLAVFIYILIFINRQTKINKEIESLKETLIEMRKKGSG